MYNICKTCAVHEIKSPCEGHEGHIHEGDGPISISIEKVVFLFTILIVGGVTSALVLLIEKVIAANKSEQVEQHYIVDQIMAADDSYNSTVSGMHSVLKLSKSCQTDCAI